jgi:predicted GH43/DUF377 family glycosyl hydrolase
LKKSASKGQGKARKILKKHELLLHDLQLAIEEVTKTRKIPRELKSIPFADEHGVVLGVRSIRVNGLPAAYNASIFQEGDGYLLFLRFDTLQGSNIGSVRLNKEFEVLEETFKKLNTKSSFSEDARIFRNGDCHFLVFNDLMPDGCRGMRMGLFDLKKRELEDLVSFEVLNRKMEKNWTPFSYKNEIYFLYTIHPQKIYKASHFEKRKIECVASHHFLLEWPKIWGDVRGGTPAQLIDDEYLAFFHSSFEDQRGVLWYVMGAYIFASSPPFQLTGISSYPILFEAVYDTPHHDRANPRIRALYPMGFVYERQQDMELLHVSCGENDSAIKIITIDKKQLLASLKRDAAFVSKQELTSIFSFS